MRWIVGGYGMDMLFDNGLFVLAMLRTFLNASGFLHLLFFRCQCSVTLSIYLAGHCRVCDGEGTQMTTVVALPLIKLGLDLLRHECIPYLYLSGSENLN